MSSLIDFHFQYFLSFEYALSAIKIC